MFICAFLCVIIIENKSNSKVENCVHVYVKQIIWNEVNKQIEHESEFLNFEDANLRSSSVCCVLCVTCVIYKNGGLIWWTTLFFSLISSLDTNLKISKWKPYFLTWFNWTNDNCLFTFQIGMNEFWLSNRIGRSSKQILRIEHHMINFDLIKHFGCQIHDKFGVQTVPHLHSTSQIILELDAVIVLKRLPCRSFSKFSHFNLHQKIINSLLYV